MALDVKKAVELVRGCLSDVLQIPAQQLLLEEVELSENQQFWLITLSYPGPAPSPAEFFISQNRAYKVVKLQADTGQMVSIKIRTLAAA
jgi:hypothetical protein